MWRRCSASIRRSWIELPRFGAVVVRLPVRAGHYAAGDGWRRCPPLFFNASKGLQMVSGKRLIRPQKRRLAGVDLVTIPADHYAALLECRRLLEERKIDHNAFSTVRTSQIERDPEIATFIAMRLGRLPIEVILKQCRRQFGKGLVPSRSATYRYWQKLRREASLKTP